MKRWLNSSENQFFRTRPGKVWWQDQEYPLIKKFQKRL
jgi:hypothetical protein